jgi:hypothetical protein
MSTGPLKVDVEYKRFGTTPDSKAGRLVFKRRKVAVVKIEMSCEAGKRGRKCCERKVIQRRSVFDIT